MVWGGASPVKVLEYPAAWVGLQSKIGLKMKYDVISVLNTGAFSVRWHLAVDTGTQHG
jgi:hypothetical protein